MGGLCSSPGSDAAQSPLPAPVSQTGSCLAFEMSHDGAVNDVCPAGGPGSFWSCGDDRRALLHDVMRGSTLSSLETGHTRAVNRLCFSSSVLATASRDRTIRIWRAPAVNSQSPAPAPALVHDLHGHDLTVSAVHLTVDGSRLASGSRDSSVRVWDVEAGRSVMRAERSQNIVTCLRWHPAAPQTVIVQGGEDLRVRLWDTRAGHGSMREAQVGCGCGMQRTRFTYASKSRLRRLPLSLLS